MVPSMDWGQAIAGENASWAEGKLGEEDWQVVLSECLLSFPWQIPALLG